MAKKQKNEFYIDGKIVFVGLPIYYTEKMSKRVLVMEVYVKEYRQEVAFDFVNENMPLLDNIREGDWVGVDFNMRGRKHIQSDGKARWFVNVEGISAVKQD